MTTDPSPRVICHHHAPTGSCQYLLIDDATKSCAIVDPVLDFDAASGAVTTDTARAILDTVAREGLTVGWIVDTHPHADHLTAAHWLHGQTGAPTATGALCAEIAGIWSGIYNLPGAFDTARDHDRLLEDGETLTIGSLDARVMLVPGHTLATIALVAGDAAIVADTLMHVDVGTSRADFPGGSAGALWDSIAAILALPGGTRVFVGHDYCTQERDTPAWEATVADHVARNPHVGGGRGRDDFVALREARDATLPLPRLMLHALQVNLRGGRMPPPEDDGHSYLRIPLDRF